MTGRIALKPWGQVANRLELRCELCAASRRWTNRRFPPCDHADTEELLFLLAHGFGWQVEPPLCPACRKAAPGQPGPAEAGRG